MLYSGVNVSMIGLLTVRRSHSYVYSMPHMSKLVVLAVQHTGRGSHRPVGNELSQKDGASAPFGPHWASNIEPQIDLLKPAVDWQLDA